MKTQLILQKLFLACALSLICSSQSFSQSAEVQSRSYKIGEVRYAGFGSKVDALYPKVEDYLKKQLRDLGKMRDRGIYYQITDVTLRGNYFEDRSFYAVLDQGAESQSIWIGVDTTGMESEKWKMLSEDIKQYTYDLVINFYKWEIQEEIDETEKALSYMERQQRRILRDSSNIVRYIENNEQELIDLKQAIEDNKIKHQELLEEIKQARVEADSIAIEIKKIEMILEDKKKKKEKIK